MEVALVDILVMVVMEVLTTLLDLLEQEAAVVVAVDFRDQLQTSQVVAVVSEF